jgi:hypothetical protein
LDAAQLNVKTQVTQTSDRHTAPSQPARYAYNVRVDLHSTSTSAVFVPVKYPDHSTLLLKNDGLIRSRSQGKSKATVSCPALPEYWPRRNRS